MIGDELLRWMHAGPETKTPVAEGRIIGIGSGAGKYDVALKDGRRLYNVLSGQGAVYKIGDNVIVSTATGATVILAKAYSGSHEITEVEG